MIYLSTAYDRSENERTVMSYIHIGNVYPIVDPQYSVGWPVVQRSGGGGSNLVKTLLLPDEANEVDFLGGRGFLVLHSCCLLTVARRAVVLERRGSVACLSLYTFFPPSRASLGDLRPRHAVGACLPFSVTVS